MGVTTSCSIAFYSKDKERIKKIELTTRADDFIYHLINGARTDFSLDEGNHFTEEEKEIMKVYFDEESGSVLEGYETATLNIQDPTILKKIWEKMRTIIVRVFSQSMNDYHDQLLSETADKMSAYDFGKKIFRYSWSINCISEVIGLLQLAITNQELVEITAVDI